MEQRGGGGGGARRCGARASANSQLHRTEAPVHAHCVADASLSTSP